MMNGLGSSLAFLTYVAGPWAVGAQQTWWKLAQNNMGKGS